MQKEKILVTGGAGFIGSHFVDAALAAGYSVLTVDKLDYCGNLLNLEKALRSILKKHFKTSRISFFRPMLPMPMQCLRR